MSAAIPDYLEPFEGWRVWRISGDGSEFRLRSVVQDTVWPPREEFVASCLKRKVFGWRHRSRHEAPAEPCACGIYATTLERLGRYLHELGDGRTRYVFGRVRLWGAIVECEHGFRASRAYPTEIIVPTPPETRAKPAGLAAPQPPRGATADEIAHELSRYAVPVITVPHSPGEAVELVVHRVGREGHLRAVG